MRLVIIKIVGLTVVLAAVVGLTAGCYSHQSGGMLARLRYCETGGNYQMGPVYEGGRVYEGAYGFDVGYWRAQGHSPDPKYASPALQDAVILQDINAMGVYRSNPGCAAKLGL